MLDETAIRRYSPPPELLRGRVIAITGASDGIGCWGYIYAAEELKRDFAVHDIDVDSKGNIVTGETLTGRRVQRFLYKGLRPAPKQDWVD